MCAELVISTRLNVDHFKKRRIKHIENENHINAHGIEYNNAAIDGIFRLEDFKPLQVCVCVRVCVCRTGVQLTRNDLLLSTQCECVNEENYYRVSDSHLAIIYYVMSTSYMSTWPRVHPKRYE